MQDLNVEWYTKVAVAVQNAIQCYRVMYDEKKKKKRATIWSSLDHFFKKVDRIDSGKEPELVPSTSGRSETAACPHPQLLTIIQLDHPSPPPPPSVSNSSCFSCDDASPGMPAVVLYYFTFQDIVL